MVWGGGLGYMEDVETLADRAILPLQPHISQSLKDWLVNIIRGNYPAPLFS